MSDCLKLAAGKSPIYWTFPCQRNCLSGCLHNLNVIFILTPDRLFWRMALSGRYRVLHTAMSIFWHFHIQDRSSHLFQVINFAVLNCPVIPPCFWKVVFVIPFIRGHFPLADLENPVHKAAEKMPVMADQYKGARELFQGRKQGISLDWMSRWLFCPFLWRPQVQFVRRPESAGSLF